MTRTALILGAGLGGLVAAETLRKLLPASERVIAVDRAERHFFPPSLLWLMVGERKPEDFTRSLDRLIGRGVEFRHGDVTRIDPQRREVEVGGESLTADALVIALGAEYAPEAIAGLAQAGLNLYTMEGATAIRDALARFPGGRIVVLTAAPQYKCPAAPYEAALLVDAFLRKRGLREKTAIDFFAAEPRPMFVTGPELGAAVRGMIEARGISYHPEHQVKEVDPAARRTARRRWCATPASPTKRAGLRSTGTRCKRSSTASSPSATSLPSPSRWASRCPRPASSPTTRPRWWRTTSPTPGPARARRASSRARACASSRPATAAPASARATSTPSRH